MSIKLVSLIVANHQVKLSKEGNRTNKEALKYLHIEHIYNEHVFFHI